MELRRKPIKPRKSDVQLMFSTHDPLEDLHRAERAQEDDYFRKRDQELIVALREKNAEEIEQAIRTYTWMRCPKCGGPLEAMPDRQVTITTCPRCGSIWLDKGEWEGIVGPKEHGWLQRLFAGLIVSKQYMEPTGTVSTYQSSWRGLSQRRPGGSEGRFFGQVVF